jgi:hypothetical protein
MEEWFWWQNLRERRYLEDRYRWKDTIKIDLKEIGWGGGVDWIRLAQGRDKWLALVNTVVEPTGFIKSGKFLD